MKHQYTEKNKETKRLYHIKNRKYILNKKHERYLKNKDTILFKSKKDWKDKILNESKEEKQKRLK